MIGFSNTAARFVSGWITKIPHMSPLLVNNIGLTVAGITTLLVPFCSTYPLLITYCLVWGGFIGKFFVLNNQKRLKISIFSFSCFFKSGFCL